MKTKIDLLRHCSTTPALFGAYLVVGALLVGIVLAAQAIDGWKHLAGPRIVSSSVAALEVQRAATSQSEPVTFSRRLDGISVSSREAADALPFGVMIENMSVTRPQSGLSKASVVYETLAEGGITRFLAIFPHDADVSKIGPVRSARHYYVDWDEEYGASYVHAGGSPLGLSQIARDHVADINGIGNAWKYFWRDRAFPAPHNLFTSADQVRKAMDELGYNKAASFDPWSFSDAPLPTSVPAASVNVDFSSPTYAVRFEYDAVTGRYHRFNGNAPHLDRGTGEQLSFSNVIVQFVAKPVPLGQKARIDLETEGEGRALVFRNGVVEEGAWRKQGTSGRTTYVSQEGSPMPLTRGSTWVVVIPNDRKVEYR